MVTEPGERAVGRRRWRRTLAITIAATAALSACSCTGDDDDPPPDKTTSSTTPQEEEVETAYLAYWDMLTRLSGAPDPNDPEIAERATGQAMSEVIDGLNRLISAGQRAEPGPLYGHDVLSTDVSGTAASVRDCTVDDSTIRDVLSGEIVSGGEAATGLLEARLVESDGRWKVEQVTTIETWPGVSPCESDPSP